MKKAPRLSRTMHKLLLKEGIDNFSVTQLRDEAIAKLDLKQNAVEVRIKLYRQLLRLEQKGLLSTVGNGRTKKYKKTELFEKQFKVSSNQLPNDNNPEEHQIEGLLKERRDYQGELEITLGEVEHYHAIIKRFPNQKLVITELRNEAKEKAASLLGKINATSKVISAFGIRSF